jgi:hypothetical protein
MRALLIIAALLAAGCASAAGDHPPPAALFVGLDGSCWRASLAGGNSDTHCFSSAVGGKLAMDVHKVRNAAGAVVYEGVTVYRLEASGAWAYDYSNAFGSVLKGYARREGPALRFSATPDVDAAATTRWRLDGDAYEAATGPDITRFRRSGPTGEDGL